MTTFDTDLVGRWFDFLLDPEQSADDFWGLRPSDAEMQVLSAGGQAIAAAVAWSELPPRSPSPLDPAAALLQAYLTGMATGIAGARQTMVDTGDLDEIAAADRLSLVAGLIAGGAAVQVAPGPRMTPSPTRHDNSSAADLARSAGTTAAELVVDGADLHSITSAAAGIALAAGPPDAANRETSYRARALVGLVLVALQRSTAPAGATVPPPSCGARPGVNTGADLRAEITFTMFLTTQDADSLRSALDLVSDEVVVWSEGDRRSFHVHTVDAGEVVAQSYAIGSVFSLVIRQLG